MIGTLKGSNGDSRINGTLLGRKGDGDPYGAATSFLSDNNCQDGDCVTVTGTQEADAFYIDSAVKEAPSKCKPGFAMAVGKDLGKGQVKRAAPQSSSKKKAIKPAKSKGTKKAVAPRTKQAVSRRGGKKKKASVAKGRRGRNK